MPFSKKLLLYTGLLKPIKLMLLVALVAVGGYMAIEGYTFLEAVYMTVITVGGVGYGEVRPLSNAGRIFTIGLIVVNLGLITYFIAQLTRFFTDGTFTKMYKKFKMDKEIIHLQGHVIICGFGRNGKESAYVLHKNNIPFVVIDDKIDLQGFTEFDVPYFITGDATQDEVLLEAGITKAKALICCLPADASNLFVVLTAKQLCKDLFVVSRASQDSSVSKLKIAGAANVIMPEKAGGSQMATLVMQPDAVELLSYMSTQNNQQFRVTELTATKAVHLSELDLWSKTGCTVLGIKNADGSYTLNPTPIDMLSPGDRVIVMGSDGQLEQAKGIL
jgi:voltage-gated potassium channel